MTIRRLLLLFLFFAPLLQASTNVQTFIKELLDDGVTVDLKNPEYSDGVLHTSDGGVVTTKNIRIQAQNITYTKKDPDIFTVCAEGDLKVDYGQHTLVGERVEFDFNTNHGTLYNGRSGKTLWYYGGERIILREDGDLDIFNGYITTSENIEQIWQIRTGRVHVYQNHYICATNIQFRFFNTPIFWLPYLKTNLNWIVDNPIHYRVKWGGKQGLRLGMTYQFINWDVFKANLRFDYRIRNGPGVGLETDYRSRDRTEFFRTINYIANDPSIEKPRTKTRYRMEGVYHNEIVPHRFTINGSYDKLSDKYMARDYYDRGLDLKTAFRSFLNVRRQLGEFMIANLSTQVRLNDFQTVKQQLPVIATTLHPFNIGCTGIVAEAHAKAGFLDFKYADDVQEIPDYSSGRIEAGSGIYRPFCLGPVVLTPEAKVQSIFYNNSQEGDAQWLVVGIFSGEAKTAFYKNYFCARHTLEPYTRFTYLTTPSSGPDEHFIFDISDGINTLKILRYGFRNLIYFRDSCGNPGQELTADVYTYSFFETPTVPKSIPKYYAEFTWSPFPTMRQTLNAAWDAERGIVDHFNFRIDWTIGAHAALAAEYRHRSPYAWRKSVYDNFILESTRTEQELRNSLLSDARDTFIYHFFYRINMTLAFQLKQRFGWGRCNEPAYKESQFDTLITLPSSWNLRISYRNKETEHRVAFYFSLGSPDY